MYMYGALCNPYNNGTITIKLVNVTEELEKPKEFSFAGQKILRHKNYFVINLIPVGKGTRVQSPLTYPLQAQSRNNRILG